jgi:hypothetical protein
MLPDVTFITFMSKKKTTTISKLFETLKNSITIQGRRASLRKITIAQL